MRLFTFELFSKSQNEILKEGKIKTNVKKNKQIELLAAPPKPIKLKK